MTLETNQTAICRCCAALANPIFTGMLFEHIVRYFECPECDYIQTEAPYWLDQAYAEVINDSDTGIMMRNQINARITLATLLLLGKLNGTLVDCAGGYGILVRLLRDFGVNALWSDQYCENLTARGFEHRQEPADLVTAFEAFEHFVNPAQELDKLLAIAPNVLLSTEIVPIPVPKQTDWWYYGPEHGQHIGFFRLKTLQRLVERRDKYLFSDGKSYHFVSDKPINHKLWLTMLRANKLVPLLLRKKLRSKVWSDHELIVRNKK